MSKLVFRKNFLRKLWWDGRMGHANYLMFLLALVNFVLIAYNFLLEGNPIFNEFISDMWMFIIIFTVFYVPIAVLIGRWHTNTQISVEMTMKVFEDPITANMIRTLLDVQTGKATKEEIEKFRKSMIEIEKKDIDEF
jgi:uncharacterized protein YneF (UPF0154 family)